MPFDYVQYQQKVNTLSTEQLHKEWENYTRQIAGGATSTATSVLFSPVTGGVSLIGLGLSAPRIHNARKKREIIEAGLQARGETHSTRKRDVVAPMAVAGAISGLTLGLATPGAELLGAEAGAKGLEYVVSHAALEGTGAILEQKHDDLTKKKGEAKLKQQQQNFQKQQAMVNGGYVMQPQVVGYQTTMQAPQNLVHLHGVEAPPGMIAMMAQPSPRPIQYQQQPQILGQDQKHIYAPVPVVNPAPQLMVAACGPASHQQQLVQQPNPPNKMISQTTVLQYQQLQHTLQQQTYQQPSQEQQVKEDSAIARRYPSEKQAETSTITQPEGYPPCAEPLPVYSPLSSSMDPPVPVSQKLSTQGYFDDTPQITLNELPAECSSRPRSTSAESAMDEEIALLKARLLQMELEKRELSLSVPEAPPQGRTPAPVPFQRSAGLGCSDQEHASRASTPMLPPGPPPQDIVQTSPAPSALSAQSLFAPPTSSNYIPSPMSTPPPQYNDNAQSNQNSTPVQQQQNMPPPPPGPPPTQYQTYPITSAPLPQQPQYQPHPTKLGIQRNDSGYYSQPLSRTTSASSTPYVPTPQSQYSIPIQSPKPQTSSTSILSPVSPQSTGASVYNPSHHRYSTSSTSLYTPTSTPGSALYFPPPSGTTNLPAVNPIGNQDYFPPQQGFGTLQQPVYQPQVQMQPQMTGQMYSSQPPLQSPMQSQMTGKVYPQPPPQPIPHQQTQGSQGWQRGVAQPQPPQQQQYNPRQLAQQVQMGMGYPAQQQVYR